MISNRRFSVLPLVLISEVANRLRVDIATIYELLMPFELLVRSRKPSKQAYLQRALRMKLCNVTSQWCWPAPFAMMVLCQESSTTCRMPRNECERHWMALKWQFLLHRCCMLLPQAICSLQLYVQS